MYQFASRRVSVILSIAALTASLCFVAIAPKAQEVGAASTKNDIIEQGRIVAFDRKRGNCLACHAMEGGNLPGNIGPPLIAMKARFPDKAKLRAQIANATVKNPNSIMPPFEKHGVLTSEEVDQITEFVYTL
jgi:sulfur-oxidizing protein SoxX